MRKLTLLIISLFVALGTMAQIEGGKYYRIKDNASGYYLNAANHNTHTGGTNGGVNVVALDEASDEMIFLAEPSGDGFKLKTKSGYYINGQEWNVDANSTTDGAVLLFEQVGDNYHIKWVSTAQKYLGQTKYFKVENVGGTIYPFCDAAVGAAATWTIEWVTRSEYVHNTYSINRDDRRLNSFTITDGERNLAVSSIQTSNTSPVYVDKTDNVLKTVPGATLSFSAFSYTSTWMHAYAYIDYNKDGFFALFNNNNGDGNGEIVSYNYFNENNILGDAGSRGNAINNPYGENKTGISKGMPEFTLPANLPNGEYRMRVKVDWNNIDADYGDMSISSGNTLPGIAHNGGCQCDFTIKVTNEFAKAELGALVEQLNAYSLGDAIGLYSSSAYSHDDLNGIKNNASNFYNGIDDNTPVADIQGYISTLNTVLPTISLNVPAAGKHYRFRHPDADGNYMLSDKYSETRLAMGSGELISAIFYYGEDGSLRSFASGLYLPAAVRNGNWTCVETPAVATFGAGSAAGTCGFYIGDDPTRAYYSGRKTYVDAGGNIATNAGYDWVIEEVTELPVAHINNVGYTTLDAAKAAALATTDAVEIVLLAGTDATIVFPANVTINKNGFTANNLAVAVAKIGDVLYATLAEAANVATKGQTVTILRSTDETAVFAYGVVIEKAEGVVAPNATNEVAVDVPADVVGNIVNNSGVETETVNGVVGALQNNEAVISNTPTNLPVGAKLVVTLVNIIFESEAPAKVVYDVTPKNGDAEVEPTEEITFRLPVPANWKYAKVYHAGTALKGIYPVQEGNYVEVASQDFSEFAVEIAEPVAKIGDVDYYTFEAALAAAQANETITLVADVTCTEKPVFNNGGVVNVDINGHVLVSNEQGRIRNVASADGTVASNNIKFVSGFGWEVYSGNGVENANFRVFPTLGEAVAYIPASDRVARIYLYENIKLENNVTLRKYPGGTSSTICVEPGYEITLDLNGYTVLQESPTGNPLEACIRGKFTLDDTSEAKTGKWIAGACGVTDTSNKNWYGGGGPAFYVLDDGELILKGGTVSIARNTSMNSNGEPVVNTGGLIRLDSGSLTVDGATLQCDDTYGVMAWGGKVVVNSGEFVMGEKGAYSVFASKYYADASVEVNTVIDGYLLISSTATATVNAAGVKYVANGTDWVAPAVGEGLIALDGQVYVPAVDVPENVVGNIVSNNSGNSNVTEDAVTAIVNNIYNNGAVIKYVPTNVPDGAKLVVELKNVIFKSASTVPATVVYDVTPKKDGAKVEPENAITFRLPVPESWAGKYTKVYHAGTALEGMYPVQEGNYVEVASLDFSEFAVEAVDYIVLPDGVNSSNCAELFGDNTVTDGTNYYATLQAAVEAVAGQADAVLYCKPGADVGSLQHAPVTSTLTVYGNGADVTGGAERDFDLGNTDPSGGKDITADMTLTVKHLNGCGAWGAKATEHTVNLVFENCANMGKVFITGTTGTLNITMTDCAFEGVIKEAVYSNADGAITLTNVAFSNLNKAVNLNHKAAGTQTVTIDGCTFTNCGAEVAADQIPVRVLSSVEGGKSVLTVTGSTFTGTPDGGADILLDYGVGLTTASVSGTAANVVVEKENNVGTTTAVKADETVEFTTALPVAQVGETKYMTLAEALAAVQDNETVTLLADVTYTKATGFVNGSYVDGLVYDGDKNFTVDFNGKTITENGEINDYLVYLKNTGEKDNEITFKNGTIAINEESTNTAWAAITVGSTSSTHKTTLNLNGMKVINGNPNAASNQVIRIREGATANLNDGTLVTSNGTSYGVVAQAASVVNINSGAKVLHTNSGTTGGNVVYTAVSGNGTINIYDGAVIESDKYAIHNMTSGNAVINIYGGTITAPVAVHAATNGGADETATVNITGGTINGVMEEANSASSIIVSGGTFTVDVSEFCAEGYVCKANGDGTYGVEEKVELPEVVITDIKGSLKDSDPDLTFALNFAIKDVENLNPEYLEKLFAQYGDWYTDYVLTISGLTDENVTFNANGNGDGYLAGQYDAWSENWVSVPFEDVTLANGTSIYIMEYAAKLMNKQGLRFTLAEVAEIVQNFDCGVYFTPEFLAANPGLKVDLHLKVFTEDAEGNKVNDINVATNNFDVEDYVAIVHAAGKQTQYCTTLADAVAAATDGATVTMLGDVELTESLVIAAGKEVVLDLNGKTVSMADASGKGAYAIKNEGNLTIVDNSDAMTGKITFNSTTPDSSFGYATSTIGNGGSLTVESGIIENTTVGGASYAIDGIWHTGEASLTINGGTIVANKIAVRQVPFSATANNAVTVNGGTLTGATAGLQLFNINNDAKLAEVNIHGGEFNGTYAFYTSFTSAAASEDVAISIDGGEFNGYLYLYNGNNGSDEYPMTVSVTGGTFNGGAYIYTKDANGADVAIPSISGGTFANDVTDYCADGYLCEANVDGTYGIVADPSYIAVFAINDADKVDYVNDTEKTVGTLTYNRTLIEGIWNPLYLPFQVDVSKLADNYDIAYYNQMLSSDSDNDGAFDSYIMEVAYITSGTLRANYPYFIRPKTSEDCDLEYVANDVTLYAAVEKVIETSSVANTFKLHGTHKTVSAADLAGCYTIKASGSWIQTEIDLRPHRLYLEILQNNISPFAPAVAKSIRIVVSGEDGTTGVDEIRGENGDDMIFDLQGRRVLEPQKGGLYIINGKKVVY